MNYSLLGHRWLVAPCLRWILGTGSRAASAGRGTFFHFQNSEVPLSMARPREMQEFSLPYLIPTVQILVYCLKTLLSCRLLLWGNISPTSNISRAWRQSTNWRPKQHIFISTIYRAGLKNVILCVGKITALTIPETCDRVSLP